MVSGAMPLAAARGMLDSNADIDDALQAAGVSVAWSGGSTFGILDELGALESTDGAFIQRVGTTVSVRTGTVPGLAQDLPLAVDGIAYVVRWFDPIEDGRMTRIQLTAVTS